MTYFHRNGARAASIACVINAFSCTDMDRNNAAQVLQVTGPQRPDNAAPPEPAALQAPEPAAESSPVTNRLDTRALSQHLATQELVAPPSRPKGCRTLLPTGAGPLLTGSISGELGS